MIKHVSNKIQNAIQMELFKAKESIKIAVAWFTNEMLLQPLILKLRSGVSVELILNNDEINRGGDTSLDFTEFIQVGGFLRWNDSRQLLHEKFCIIDDRIVITGSYNWTNKAEFNSEVENFFYDEEETTEFYNELYNKLSVRFEGENSVVTQKGERPEVKSNFDEEGFYIDEQGAKYSNDRKRLIKVPGDELRIEYINRAPGLYISGKCPISYHIPDGVTTIEDFAFSVCASLKSVYIPNSVTSIGKGAFSSCRALTSIHVPDSVTSIGDGAFNECGLLKSIRLPNSLTSIGANTFNGCSSITSIHIPDSVVNIGEAAFGGCRNLTSIRLPDGVTRIEERAFAICKKLASVEIPDSVNYIGDSAFYECESLISLHIPYSIKSVENEVFSLCRRLKHIIIPNNVTSIGKKAFWYTDLRSINIPDSVKSIGEGAIGNTLIDTIYVPVGSKSRVEKMTGWNMRYMKVVEYNVIEDLYKQVTEYDLDNAWTDEYGVKYSQDKKRLLKAPEFGLFNYSIRNGTEVICNNAFDRCSNLVTIHIPNSVICIGDWAFAYCGNLTSIHIPDSVTSIGNAALMNCCNLTSLYIPDNVIYIGRLAFGFCKAIKTISIYSKVNSIGIKAFYRCDSLTAIYIPYGTKSKFENMLSENKDKLIEQ